MWPTFYRHASSSINPVTGDVVLLLHGDGVNNGTVFTDSSLYNRTATRVGNTVTSTAQSKFGGSSIYFDGNGDYLTFPDDDAWFFDTDDWTVEMYFMAVSYNHAATSLKYPNLIGQRTNYNNNHAWDTYIVGHAGGSYLNLNFSYDYPSASPSGATIAGDGLLGTMIWHHVAWSREGATLRGFLDGVLLATHNIGTRSINNSTEKLYIGALPGVIAETYWKGWIEELRIIRGQAYYTATFTPPAAPHPDP